MDEWIRLFKKSAIKPEDLDGQLGATPEEVKEAIEVFPMRINSYFLDLMKEKGDPIARQVVPSPEESRDGAPYLDDPLDEEKDSPVPGLVHRYPDRVLLMVTTQCPIYCRFCTRKRIIGRPGIVSMGTIRRGIDYIRNHGEVRDVILSGGDPLMLKDEVIEEILQGLRAIPHLEIIRIGSRVPGALPQRVTERLCEMLKKYHPLFMNLHFNHPDEVTPEAKKACEMLADAGIPLGSQTVLLKGINDDPQVMKRLMQKLLTCRVKPYYIYQADLVSGTDHFRTTVEAGLEIMRHLQGHTSGMAVPKYVIDAPHGGGKVPINPPDFVLGINEKEVVVKNYENQVYSYPQVIIKPEEIAVHSGETKEDLK
ncbi:MAG TPA: KamA family radical SAM protein [Nitrospiria bacterium]|nr:KamA family radical SAM protein [Nitrospiria bacterium]